MIDRPRKILPFPMSVRARLRREQEDEAIEQEFARWREEAELEAMLTPEERARDEKRRDEILARFQRAWKRKFLQ